jgi:hypothetical protein
MAHHVPTTVLFGGANSRHVCRNITTIESLENTRYIHTQHRPSNQKLNAFDLGTRANWNQVMGPDRLKWFIPVMNSMGNGLSFPVSEDVKMALRGMSVEEEDEDEVVFRRGEEGRWMLHD